MRIVCFFLVLLLLLQICNYLIAPDNTYTRVMMHEMYETQKEIDMVFLGGSTTYTAFDPEIWDNALNIYSFNLGSSNQTPDSSYYLLKELFAEQEPKYCIYGLSDLVFTDLTIWDSPTYYYILSDYFRPSHNKFQYMLHAYNVETICAAIFPFLRNRSDISLQTISNNLKKKRSENYRNYGYDIFEGSSMVYMGRGYVYSNNQTETGAVGALQAYPFSEGTIAWEHVDYLQKMVDLCRKHDCELILIAPPIPYAHMAFQEDYQAVCSFYQQLSKENNVALFDFTLAKPELLARGDDSFYDWIHMSGVGATAFSSAASQIVADYVTGKKIDYDNLFYSSYQELLDASPYVFNAWLTREGEDYIANCTFGNNVIPEYQFAWRESKEDEWQILQGYSTDKTLETQLVPESATQLRLYVRPVGCGDSYQQSDILKIS